MWKKCKVVMLATNKAQDSLVLSGKNKLWFFKGYFTQDYLESQSKKSFHLYILSDDEIKEGDWVLTTISEIDIYNHIEKYEGKCDKEYCKKIIATTDTSLEISHSHTKLLNDKGDLDFPLPLISQSFIEHFISEYNKGNIITEVMVEVDDTWIDTNGKMAWGKPYEYKLNPDNTINIKPLKEFWTREELPIDIMLNLIDYIDNPVGRRQYHSDVIEQIQELKKWIEFNL